MNKIKAFIISALLVFSGSAVFADYGAGAEIGFEENLIFDTYHHSFTSATYRSDESPWCFSLYTWPFDLNITATADNWFVNERLNDRLDYYFFWGISGHSGFDDFNIGTGARLGGGVDWFLLDSRNLELYWQVCWNPYFGIQYIDSWEPMVRPCNIPFSTGARWWFR